MIKKKDSEAWFLGASNTMSWLIVYDASEVFIVYKIILIVTSETCVAWCGLEEKN